MLSFYFVPCLIISYFNHLCFSLNIVRISRSLYLICHKIPFGANHRFLFILLFVFVLCPVVIFHSFKFTLACRFRLSCDLLTSYPSCRVCFTLHYFIVFTSVFFESAYGPKWRPNSDPNWSLQQAMEFKPKQANI